jgi:hypothetical protein
MASLRYVLLQARLPIRQQCVRKSVQLDVLTKIDCVQVFQHKESGTKADQDGLTATSSVSPQGAVSWYS